jgi:hypothetical protein
VSCAAWIGTWNLKLQYGGNLRDEDACTGWAWRALIAALLPAPGETQSSTCAACGVKPPFVIAITAAMPPGSSAVLMRVPRSALLRILAELQHFGGTLLETPIDWAAVARLG